MCCKWTVPAQSPCEYSLQEPTSLHSRHVIQSLRKPIFVTAANTKHSTIFIPPWIFYDVITSLRLQGLIQAVLFSLRRSNPSHLFHPSLRIYLLRCLDSWDTCFRYTEYKLFCNFMLVSDALYISENLIIFGRINPVTRFILCLPGYEVTGSWTSRKLPASRNQPYSFCD